MVNIELKRELYKCSTNNEQISIQLKDLKKDFARVAKQKVEVDEFKKQITDLGKKIDII